MSDRDEKWEENKAEVKELAQEFIFDERRRSECIDKAHKLAEYKAQVEHQIEESMKDIKKLPIGEKIEMFSKITKLKKELRKL